MKWHWTPNGWAVGILSVGCLVLSGLIANRGGNSVIVNILLIFGVLVGILGYIRTFLNIKKKNKGYE